MFAAAIPTMTLVFLDPKKVLYMKDCKPDNTSDPETNRQ
jgi:hypothetical protein